MDDNIKPTAVFWIVGILLLLFGIMGASGYVLEMTMDETAYLESYGQAAVDIRHITPKWSIAGYAIGVWSGLLGAILLLLRKAWAVRFYVVSALGALLGWIWYIIDPRAHVVMFEERGWIFMVFILIACMFSIWWAKRQTSKGLLN